jgi:hypothetical protein
MHSRSTRDQTNISRQQIEIIGAAGGSQPGQEEFRESGLSRGNAIRKEQVPHRAFGAIRNDKELGGEGMLLL